MQGSANYLPLWLELRVGDQSWLFEFRAGDQRAVVVGSHLTSDVRVTREGVAATHFHFEREADAIVVVPGYRAALLLHEAPISEPAVIAMQGYLDFCGVRLEAEVHDVPPLHLLPQTRHGTDRTRHAADYCEALPGEADPTVTDLRALSRAESTHVPNGARRALPDEDEFDMRTTTAFRASPPIDGFGPFGTVVMQLPPNDDVPPVSARVSERLPAPSPASTQRLRLEPWTTMSPEPQDTSPTPVDLPPHRVSTSPSLAPTASRIALIRKPSLLEQLGTAASKHPLGLAAAAVPICLMIALAIMGAARLVREGRSSSGRADVSLAAMPPMASLAPTSAPTEAASAVATVSSPTPSASATDATLPSAASPIRAPARDRRSRPGAGRAQRESKHVFLGE